MSETGKMRGAERADVVFLGVFGEKVPFFEQKGTHFRENSGAEA